MKRRSVLVVMVVLALSSVLPAQSALTPEAQLKAAINREVIDGDLAGAIQQYEAIATKYAANHAVAAKALLQLAGIYERQGRAEARSTYQRIIDQFGDTGTTATTARARLTALQQAGTSAFPERNLDQYAGENGRQWSTVSPDGKLIAYVDFRALGPGQEKRNVLCVAPVAGGKERVLATPKNADEFIGFSVVWSPNSQQVAYLVPKGNRAFEFRVVALSTGVSRSLGQIDAQNPFANSASWAPDSAHVAIISRKDPQAPWSVDLASVSGSGNRSLGVSPTNRVAWSPDGTRVAIANAGPTPGIRVVSMGGELVRSTATPLPTAETQVTVQRWTRDDRILFSQNVKGGNDFYAWALSSGEPKKICEGRAGAGGDGCGVISPDGLWQITRKNISGGGRIGLRNTVDGSERLLTREAVTEDVPVFSPDSQLLAFRSNREGPWAIYVVAIKQTPGATPVKVTQLESVDTRATPSWTANGLVLLMQNSQQHLYRIDVDPTSGKPAGVPVRVTREGPANVSPIVSPDGTQIAYLTGDTRVTAQRALAVVKPDGTGQRRVCDLPTGSLLGWRSATEVLVGRMKALNGPRHQEWSFEIVNVTTGNSSPVPGVTVLGTGVQYARGTNEVFSYTDDLASLQVTPLSGASGRTIKMTKDWMDFTVAPTGRLVAYSTTDYGSDGNKKPAPGESRLMNLANGDDKLVVRYADSDDGSHMTVEFSPDGRYLIYLDPAGEQFIMDVETGSAPWPFINGQPAGVRIGGEPSWSPDGRYIMVTGTLPRASLRLFGNVTADAVSRIAAGKK